jgi:hypothetical protein
VTPEQFAKNVRDLEIYSRMNAMASETYFQSQSEQAEKCRQAERVILVTIWLHSPIIRIKSRLIQVNERLAVSVRCAPLSFIFLAN